MFARCNCILPFPALTNRYASDTVTGRIASLRRKASPTCRNYLPNVNSGRTMLVNRPTVFTIFLPTVRVVSITLDSIPSLKAVVHGD